MALCVSFKPASEGANVLICEVFDEILFGNASLHNTTQHPMFLPSLLFLQSQNVSLSCRGAGSKQDALGGFN